MSSEIIPMRQGEELNPKVIEPFLRENIENLPEGKLIIKQFSAGRSNLTYHLKIGGWEGVLRTPPLGPVAPKAHDMEREFHILKEIYPYFPQAPKPYVYSDKRLFGRTFFVMERKKGIVLDTAFPDNVTVTEDLCRNISELMVDTLVNLHQIDYKQTKLADMTKPDGFLERQVHGWIRRYEGAKTDEIAAVELLKKWLVDHIPASQEPAIIHYDFKLNNTMFNEDFSDVVGLFDWEMTTVGDPLADVGVALSYWTEAEDSRLLNKGMDGKVPITSYPGFMTRGEFIEAYAKKSGRDVSQIHFYLIFAYFKLAVICQQIYFRFWKGQTNDDRFAGMNVYVRNLITYALETVNRKV